MAAVSYLAAIGIASGALLTLYRNDSLLAMARTTGAEAKYLQFESSVLGSPGWGTPRSLELLVEASKVGIDEALIARRDRLLSGASGPPPTAKPATAPSTPATVAAATAAPEAPVRAPEPPPAADSASGAVSLESLPVATAEPAAPPEPKARSLVQPAPERPATRTVAATRRASVAADDEPPRKAKAKKPEPESAPAPRPRNENPLKAAIRSAILKGK